VPHDHGVIAHSDGDVALHALCDALFGVIGDGDIGVHFPPSDPQWRGASSDRFLAFACERVRQRGGIIDHLDLSIVCERPKIGPFRAAMQARIAAMAGITIDQVYRSPDLALISRRIGEPTGSDHYPVVTEFTRATP
jgi:2-C-methyl-D-erythritol 4-phosphate cytidylyltransferase/2-C-methyl-D-erythritol 2,4-cyclodiphosphate synthase